MRQLTTNYHAADQPPVAETTLLLDGHRRRPVTNTVVVSQAAPDHAPPGQHLIATSVVGRETPPETVVRAELARLSQTPTTGWCHLRTVAVVGALPAGAPPRGTLRAPAQVVATTVGDDGIPAGVPAGQSGRYPDHHAADRVGQGS
ncbi:hypothetical protein ACFHWS_10540 [Micromonospora sp. LOL_013]